MPSTEVVRRPGVSPNVCIDRFGILADEQAPVAVAENLAYLRSGDPAGHRTVIHPERVQQAMPRPAVRVLDAIRRLLVKGTPGKSRRWRLWAVLGIYPSWLRQSYRRNGSQPRVVVIIQPPRGAAEAKPTTTSRPSLTIEATPSLTCTIST